MFYTRGEKPVVCLTCGQPLNKAKTPAWWFLIGRDSMDWKETWCRFCHSPHQYRRAKPSKGALEVRLMDDAFTGREPVLNAKNSRI